jgi:hypothetical protein
MKYGQKFCIRCRTIIAGFLLLVLFITASTNTLMAAQNQQTTANSAPWPAHLTNRFMLKCAKLNQVLIPYCQCVYSNMRRQIPYADFERLAAQTRFAQDQRFLRIRSACLENNAVRF